MITQNMKNELFQSDCFFEKDKLSDSCKYFVIDDIYCLANKKNIILLVEIAKRHNLQDYILYKNYCRESLEFFERSSCNIVKRHYNLLNNDYVIFTFFTAKNYESLSQLKDYLDG
jgi:hypothetical protein